MFEMAVTAERADPPVPHDTTCKLIKYLKPALNSLGERVNLQAMGIQNATAEQFTRI